MHGTVCTSDPPASLCSTPFGDIDGCTTRYRTPTPGRSRAQRLSATLMDAHRSDTGEFLAKLRAQRLSATLMDAQMQVAHCLAATLCSTPFGDIDGCTASSSVTSDTSSMCSTPFGDIDGCTIDSVLAVFLEPGCSTPFGDIDGCTRSARSAFSLSRWCSTPFGDIDGCTLRQRRHTSSHRRAQRLSATLMDALRIATEVQQKPRCSTPFGDIDGCTESSHRRRPRSRVLNAFRRH